MPVGVYPRVPLVERFWAKVNKDGPIPEYRPYLGQCWLWTGGRTSEGYGAIMEDARRKMAHRVAYELAHGPIPDGLEPDHLCRVRHCVRPDHLEAVTRRENILRGIGPTAVNARKTHCLRGHLFDADNTGASQHPPQRVCRACDRETQRRYKETKRLLRSRTTK